MRPSRARHARGFPPPGRGLRGARHGGRARFRHPVLARPSLAARASGLVQAPAGRLDPVRGEPAEEIRGHRQSRFLLRRQRGLWRRLRDVVLFWVEQGVRIFRVDNPHTKPFPFWEWLIREVQSRDPGRDLPVGGLHPAEGDEGARQARLHPVLHLFHLAHRQGGAASLSERDHPLSRSANISGRISSSTRPTSCPSICRPASPGSSRRASRSPPRCRRTTASTTASSCSSTSRSRARRNTSTPEKYELKVRDWNKPGNIKDYIGRLNRIRRENPALLQTSQPALRAGRRRGGHRLRQGIGRRRDNAVAVAIALRPTGRASSGSISATSRSARATRASACGRSRT